MERGIYKVATLFFIVGLLIGMSSCMEDKVSPGMAKVKLNFATAPSSAGSAGRIAEHTEITEAWIGVDEIEFEAEFEEGDNDAQVKVEIEYEFEGPFVVDLINLTSDPELPITEIQPGLYHEIEAELTPVVDGENSVVLKGTQDGTPFEFYWDEEIEFEIENDAGVELNARVINNVLIVLDINAWFENVDISSGEQNENGVVVISKDMNTDLLSMISSNIKVEMEFGEDDDDDGEIDDDEDDD